MAKSEAKLKSESKLDGSILTFTCTDSEDAELTFSKAVDLAALFGVSTGLALTALSFAARTALRNATGGREIDEAEAAVDARIEAWTKGDWGAERGGDGSGAPFTAGHILAKAAARVYASMFSDAKAAAAALSEKLEKALSAQGHPAWADLDEENQRKARNAFVQKARKGDSKIDLAVAEITAEMATERAAKKAKAGGSAEPTESLF